MQLKTQLYTENLDYWPSQGRAILAQFDDESIVVYQAYRPAIGHFAASNGYFGGDFKLSRMSWIKPNFLWMMYRSGWAMKDGQQVILAVRILRSTFDEILRLAVHSAYEPSVYESQQQWTDAVASSNVRLQWDPDHAPDGAKQQRRAIQLGLRGEILRKYASDWIIQIEDITEFVSQQRANAKPSRYHLLEMPSERVYPVNDSKVAQILQIDCEQAW